MCGLDPPLALAYELKEGFRALPVEGSNVCSPSLNALMRCTMSRSFI